MVLLMLLLVLRDGEDVGWLPLPVAIPWRIVWLMVLALIACDVFVHVRRKRFFAGRYERLKSALAAQHLRAVRLTAGKQALRQSLSAVLQQLFRNPVLDTDNWLRYLYSTYWKVDARELAGKFEFEDHGIQGDGWKYTDYTHVSGAIGLRKELGVLQVALPRELPHLVFDSRRVGGRNLGVHFDRNQRIVLEGNFNDFFDVYFPAHYHIDATSIMSPTVMEALLTAADYEVEIYRDTLYVYGPPFAADELPRVVAKAFAIRDALAARSGAYRDQRTGDAMTRQAIDAYGLSIQRSYWHELGYWLRHGAVVLLAALVVMAYFQPVVWGGVLLLLAILGWSFAGKLFAGRRLAVWERNSRQLRHYGRSSDDTPAPVVKRDRLKGHDRDLLVGCVAAAVALGMTGYSVDNFYFAFLGVAIVFIALFRPGGALEGRLSWQKPGQRTVILMIFMAIVALVIAALAQQMAG